VRVLGQVPAIVRLVALSAGSVVVVAIVVGASIPNRASAALLSWSSPASIDRAAPLADTTTGASVACPSVSLCVAFGDTAVEVSRKPSRPGSWSVPRPVFSPSATRRGPGFLASSSAQVSCPSVSLCVAISGFGEVAVSKHPESRAWRVHQLVKDPVDSLEGISCPSVSLCVIVDFAGDVITSHHPTGGAAAWRVTRVEPASRPGFLGPPVLEGVSCASETLCVAVDDAGDLLTSRDPGGGARAWTLTNIEPMYTGYVSFLGISCSSGGACVAVGAQGYVASSTHPTDGAAAWTIIHVSGIGARVSCVARAFCVAIGSRRVGWSRNPFARSPSWRVRSIGFEGYGGALTCPSRSLCVAAGFQLIGATTHPLAGAWRTAGYPASSSLDAVSCASRSFCAAVDNAGHVLRSTRPAPVRSAWHAVSAGDPSDALSAVSCPSLSLCVETSADRVISSVHPTRDSSWRFTTLVGADLYGVSCPSATLCVATDDTGYIHVSQHPNGGARAWRTNLIDTATRLCDETGLPCPAALSGGISCPTVSFCLAVDNAGNILTSTHPAGAASTWTTTFGVVPPQPDRTAAFISAVSCPSRRMCVIANGDGSVATSTNPTGGPAAWSHAKIDRGELTGVSCPSVSLCVAVDLAGSVLTSQQPASGASSWTKKTMAPGLAFNGVSCSAGPLCVAVDSWGYATFATATRPATKRHQR
jgi:hypothetical protein